MRLAVIIPTTNGPIRIVRITRLSRAPLSQVITVDDFVPNPEITARYHALTDPSGPLRGLIAVSDARFELCLDRLPEMGRSWELPVAIAHWTVDHGHELVVSDAELVVWATGVVRPRREIAEEDYHLEQKLASSKTLLAEHDKDARLLVLLPGNASEEDVSAFLGEFYSATAVRVAGVEAAIVALEKAIGGKRSTGESATASATRGMEPKRKIRRLASGIAVLILLAAVGFGLQQVSYGEGPAAPQADTPPREPSDRLPIAPTAAPEAGKAAGIEPILTQALAPVLPEHGAVPPLLLVEQRALPGASCLEVLFGAAAAVRIERRPATNEFAASDLNGLCAISFESDGEAKKARLSLPASFLARIIPSDRAGSIDLGASPSRLFHFVAVAVPLTYEVTFIDGAGAQTVFKHSLVAR